MSNPAVIYLDTEKSGCLSGFRIEDNIGEAIHIHFDEIRLDFTIKEFLCFSESIKKSLEDLKVFDGELSSLPYDFLKRYSNILSDYNKIEFETIKAKDLCCIDEFKLFDRIPMKIIKRLTRTYVFKENIEAVSADLDALPFCDTRFIKNKMDLIKLGKRPEVILFNGSNIVRDGHLTAVAYMYLFGGNCEIPVKRVWLKHKVKDNLLKDNIKHICSSIIRKLFCILGYRI